MLCRTVLASVWAELFSDRTLTLRNCPSGKCGHSNNAKWFTVVYFWFENNLKPDLDDLAPSCGSYTGLDEVWMNYFFVLAINLSGLQKELSL